MAQKRKGLDTFVKRNFRKRGRSGEKQERTAKKKTQKPRKRSIIRREEQKRDKEKVRLGMGIVRVKKEKEH